MLISHSKQFIFIHVPKTGGTSIKFALQNYDSTFESSINSEQHNYRDILSNQFDKHITSSKFREEIPNEIWENYYKFLFVRNPWDLHVSYYNYFLQRHDHPRHHLISKMKCFEEYLEWRINEGYKIQKNYCCNENGESIVNFVGKYESLNTDFMKVCDMIKLGYISLNYMNTSYHKHYREYYNHRTKYLIDDYYHEDIEFFKYDF